MHCWDIALLVILHSMEDGNFSRYKILGELGTGGMAEVYRAYDPEFGREVALKILRREMLDDTRLRERFVRETRIIARLELEGIVPVYDMGRTAQNHLFFVMRLMTGGTLAQQMQNGPLSSDQIIHVLQRIAPALDEAHKRGIIHRDLKPANILFDENDNAFISDFGIAKSINTGTDAVTDSSGIVGTPRYMSPEQFWGDKVDARSDIYSLGVIVFEMLVGKTNFDTITPRRLAFREPTQKFPRLLDANPDLPPGVQPVMEKVLARERDERYNTATEFADALVAALKEPAPPDVQRPWFSPRLLLIGGLILLVLFSLAIWQGPNLFQPPPSLTHTATATITPTAINTPTVTATHTPTATATATRIPLPVIGGADRIAVTSKNEIYLFNADGSKFQGLTKTGRPKIDLQWLPGTNELLYVEGNCVYKIDVETTRPEPEQLVCFTDAKFAGFRVSPDGQRVAISIVDRLLLLPFDLTTLSKVSSAFELQKLDELCLDYADVTVKGALWSADGQRLAIRYQSVIGRWLGETIRVIGVDWEQCQDVPVVTWDEFPADHFVPDGYTRYPFLPSYHWDGKRTFVFNTLKRHRNYGELYLYDSITNKERKINPIAEVCCYGSAAFSPDGSYILLVFQDLRLGDKSKNRLYYLPIDQLGTGTESIPFSLPGVFFEDLDENIQLALHPAEFQPESGGADPNGRRK
jgi:serine/threonine protein kinase